MPFSVAELKVDRHKNTSCLLKWLMSFTEPWGISQFIICTSVVPKSSKLVRCSDVNICFWKGYSNNDVWCKLPRLICEPPLLSAPLAGYYPHPVLYSRKLRSLIFHWQIKTILHCALCLKQTAHVSLVHCAEIPCSLLGKDVKEWAGGETLPFQTGVWRIEKVALTHYPFCGQLNDWGLFSRTTEFIHVFSAQIGQNPQEFPVFQVWRIWNVWVKRFCTGRKSRSLTVWWSNIRRVETKHRKLDKRPEQHHVVGRLQCWDCTATVSHQSQRGTIPTESYICAEVVSRLALSAVSDKISVWNVEVVRDTSRQARTTSNIKT